MISGHRDRSIVGRTGFIISRFRELKLMTVPEYFEIKSTV